MNWPERATVVRETAKNATRIRKAFRESINGAAIAKAWAETHPAMEPVPPQMARDWAQAQVVSKKKPIELALSRLYADGYTLGDRIAQIRISQTIKKGVTAGVVDWTRWTPGSESAAALVRPQGGLAELLRTRKVQISDEVMRTKIDRIGTVLARSLESGEGVFETAKNINAIVDDAQHAMMIARTEMSRAVSVATRDTYEKNDVQQVEWLVADGCDVCLENEDASPIGIGDTFPSGDTEPPAHPNCECTLAPVFDDTELDEIMQELEAAGEAEAMDTYGAGPEEIYEDVSDAMEADTLARFQNYDYALNDLLGIKREPEGRWIKEELTDTGKALSGYKNIDYLYINGLLRHGPSDRNGRYKDYVEKAVPLIDKAIEIAPPLPKPIMTYRGIKGKDASDYVKSLKKGDTFKDKGYSSTSMYKNFAKEWQSENKGEQWLLEIQNPGGTKGIMLDGLRSNAAAVEAEWLLPRDTTFEVIAKDDINNILKVRVINA